MRQKKNTEQNYFRETGQWVHRVTILLQIYHLVSKLFNHEFLKILTICQYKRIIKILQTLIKTYISNLVRTAHFWNNFHQERS
jgi:hypothetical protein